MADIFSVAASSERHRVTVLAGGDSPEREISLASGIEVAAALDAAGHCVALLDPAVEPLAAIVRDGADCCFIALHGGAGEDGRVQAELERLGVPYTGSGPVASRLAMSKSAAKERFIARRIPTPDYVLVEGGDHFDGIARRVDRLGYPVILKPDDQGSSLGVHRVAHARELAMCLDDCLTYGRQVVAERWIDGHEFTISLIDRQVLPILEILTTAAVFSHEAKYRSPQPTCRLAAELAPAIAARLAAAAVQAAAALGTAGLCRVDLILDRRDRPWVLEINTVPGMTSRSLAPAAARAAGISMPRLCDLLVHEAIWRHRQRQEDTLPRGGLHAGPWPVAGRSPVGDDQAAAAFPAVVGPPETRSYKDATS